MAEKQKDEIATGYVIGRIGPIGRRKQLRTVIDASAKRFESIHVSAGKPGLEIELSASSLQRLADIAFVLIAA